MKRTSLRFLCCTLLAVAIAEAIIFGYRLCAGHAMPHLAALVVGLITGVITINVTTPWWMGGAA